MKRDVQRRGKGKAWHVLVSPLAKRAELCEPFVTVCVHAATVQESISDSYGRETKRARRQTSRPGPRGAASISPEFTLHFTLLILSWYNYN
jgi:hypothetical protein